MRYNEQLKRAIEESECTEENKHIAYENNYEEMIFATKEKMQEYIWDMLDEKTKERLEEIGQRIHFLEQEYSNIMQGYYAKIDEIMRYYIELSETDYWNVEVGYGKIDFLLGNKKKETPLSMKDCMIRKEIFLEKSNGKYDIFISIIRLI